jgi:hypothetical protein
MRAAAAAMSPRETSGAVSEPSILALSQFDRLLFPKEAVSKQTGGVAMTTLNGWQRLWLLASIVWSMAILALAGTPDSGWTMESALFVVRLWIVPIAAAYAFGVALVWVIRGFPVEAK